MGVGKRILVCIAAVWAGTAFWAGAAFGAGEVVLAPGQVDVVLPQKAWPVEKFAAEELTNFLSRVLGSDVPIVRRPAADRAAILLGRAAELDVSTLERDAFRMKVEGCRRDGDSTVAPRIRIAGIDEKGDVARHVRKSGLYTHIQRATLFGVYAFLEDFAGVRFYFPGELGTVANRRGEIRVPVQDRTTAPWFTVRSTIISRDGVWYEPLPEGWHANAGKALSWLRQRYETTRIPCCHGQNSFRIVERFAETHPEYCQLRKDGTRCTKLERESIGSHQKQLCQSSKVWDVFHDDILARKDPRYADVMPQDGYRACACPECQKAYRRNPDGTLAPSFASELIWGRTAELGRRFLAEGRTDITLTQMSYGAYTDVPNLDLPTNIQVMVAVSGPWSVHNEQAHAKALARIRAWEKKVGHRVWLWTYPHKFFATVLPGVPSFGPRAWGRFFKETAPDIIGSFCESETDHWLFHYLNYYVFSRIAWNPDVDVEAVLAEHDRLMFGAGAAEMGRFERILEDKWVKGIAGRIIDTPLGPQSMPPSENEIWTTVYSPDVMKELEGLLAAAEKKAGRGTLESRRVDLMRRELFGPLLAASKAYCGAGGIEGEKARRAAFPAGSDLLAGAKWRPYEAKSRIDTGVYLSAPDSLCIETTPEKKTGYCFSSAVLKPSTKYRISYFVKCDNVKPTSRGGGVCCVINPPKGSKLAQVPGGGGWTFPLYGNFLAGTTDWIVQAFEFETGTDWPEGEKSTISVRVRYAIGTAHFDDIRIDEVKR